MQRIQRADFLILPASPLRTASGAAHLYSKLGRLFAICCGAGLIRAARGHAPLNNASA